MQRKRLWLAGLVIGYLLVTGVSAAGLAKPSRNNVLGNESIFQLVTVRKSNDAEQLIRFNRRTGVTSYLKGNQWQLIKENDRRVRNSLYQVLATAETGGGWHLYRLDMISGDSWSVKNLVWHSIKSDGHLKETETKE
ncbi:MAG: hypothetical protein COA99_04795 [Moraxellaceae bacterium]|nr:MAG: hypothetical protein COA99_04795 [Moraxellaceae bacterium]